MSPAETILAEARANPLTGHVPATATWLDGWIGPVRLATDTVAYALVASFPRLDGVTGYVCASCTVPSVALCAVVGNILFDVRRPEVRARFAALGIPPRAVSDPGAALAWALNGGTPGSLPFSDAPATIDRVTRGYCVVTAADGWYVPIPREGGESGWAVGYLPQEAS